MGCTVPVPRVSVSDTEARAAWQRILDRHVGEAGDVDFESIAREPGDLEAYVGWAAENGPSSTPGRFPDRPSRLAYYLNTYNALAMWNATRGRWLPEQRIRFFFLTGLGFDGYTTSLYALENQVIRPLGDPRVHFALNCMVRSCPRLPREPWSAGRLDAQLDAAAREFVDAPRNVEVDGTRRVVRLSAIFDFYTGDFLAEATSLVAYVNRYRSEPVPEDYAVEFLPYDWSLNQSPGTSLERARRER